MPKASALEAKRQAACRKLLAEARAIHAAEGATPAALVEIKSLLVKLAAETALFPMSDFAMPVAQGRNHMLDDAENDGFGPYLTIGLPGKEAAPHDHGIWCVNAAVSGEEEHRFWRRTDDGSRPGQAAIEEIGIVTVRPGTGMAMADHDIHGTKVIGGAPAIGLALYGYALTRFPSVVWYHPEFASVRALPSKRALEMA